MIVGMEGRGRGVGAGGKGPYVCFLPSTLVVTPPNLTVPLLFYSNSAGFNTQRSVQRKSEFGQIVTLLAL